MAKAAAAPKKALNKSQLLAAIAETSQLSKKEVGAVLDALGAEIKKSLSSKGAGAITLPGLIKIVKQHVPAKPAQERSRSVQQRPVPRLSSQAGHYEGQSPAP